MTKFIVDRMLGQTAKWLRLLGVDAEYVDDDTEDALVIQRGKEESRIIITRDKTLGDRPGTMLVPNVPTEELLPQIFERYGLSPKPLTRCSLCNSPIVPVDKVTVKGDVPEGVYQRQDEFWCCSGCHRIYWKGSHWDHILSVARKVSPD